MIFIEKNVITKTATALIALMLTMWLSKFASEMCLEKAGIKSKLIAQIPSVSLYMC